MKCRLLNKSFWKNAKGAAIKAKRLDLKPDSCGYFTCPVETCDSNNFKSQRGCRKHVYCKHGWYYFFDLKPDTNSVLPNHMNILKNIVKQTRSCTKLMPSFSIDCSFSLRFIKWLSSTGGGAKTVIQSRLLSMKILKFLKYCCADTSSNWDLPIDVVDYCLGSISMISDFIDYLQDKWNVGFSGVIGYMNSISHLLDFRRSEGMCSLNISTLVATEIFISRAKKSLGKNMREEWRTILSIDYLEKIGCWANLEELQSVIPFHAPKFQQVVLNSKKTFVCVASQDLTFATSFIVAVLFLMVKATRPMTFKYLTVRMIESVGETGIIDQTYFKTREKYGFDSLVFHKDVIVLIKNYITHIRPRLNPSCEFLLVNRNGMQIASLSDVLGRIVYLAIGKYIHPTRYRQIIETESSQNLSLDEQLQLSEDQKHTSNVAKLHYKKVRSQDIAKKGAACMDKLRDNTTNLENVAHINESLNLPALSNSIHFQTLLNPESNMKETLPLPKPQPPPVKQRKKKTPFSSYEDGFLADGIQRYGIGKWSAILNDPQYKFDPSRKPATLLVRAKAKKLV